MDGSQRKFLQGKIEAHLMDEPRWPELRAKLLEIAGEEVVPREDEDLIDIIEQGRPFDHQVRFCQMEERDCHNNSVRMALENPDYELVTGYALGSDGLWRQHSWCFDPKSSQIVETTIVGTKYFGFVV